METMRKIQSRLMFSPVQEASVSIGIYQHARHTPLWELSLRTSDRNVHRTFTSSDSPFWFEWRSLDGDKRPRIVDTVGRVYVHFQRSSRARSLVSSLNPHSNVRENIARLMICVTRGRGCADRQPASPGCLSVADGGCGTKRRKETQTARQ